MISPNNVMKMVEKAKEKTPAIIDSDNKVSSTFIPTLPQRIVVNKKLESFLMFRTFLAPVVGSASASISNLSLVRLKNARFNPENMADCDIQKAIPNQIYISFISYYFEFL